MSDDATFDLDELTDDELIEEVLVRQAEVDEDQSRVLVDAALAVAGGDEQAACTALEGQRKRLVDRALEALRPLLAEAPVIYAHDELLERLEPED